MPTAAPTPHPFIILKPQTGWVPAAHFYHVIGRTRIKPQTGWVPAAHFYHAIGCTRTKPPNGTGARGPFLPCHRMPAHQSPKRVGCPRPIFIMPSGARALSPQTGWVSWAPVALLSDCVVFLHFAHSAIMEEENFENGLVVCTTCRFLTPLPPQGKGGAPRGGALGPVYMALAGALPLAHRPPPRLHPTPLRGGMGVGLGVGVGAGQTFTKLGNCLIQTVT